MPGNLGCGVILSVAKDLLDRFGTSRMRDLPSEVRRFNQTELFLSRPSLDLTLSSNSGSVVGCAFEVHETVHEVLSGEPRECSILMLKDSA
jgi:hypothetical protein